MTAQDALPATDSTLYVSADLRILYPDMQPCGWARDFTQVDHDDRRTAYRCLDLDWLTWLYDRMCEWRSEHQAGELPDVHWQHLRQQFETIYLWALRHIGPDAHKSNLDRRILSASYSPPVPVGGPPR